MVSGFWPTAKKVWQSKKQVKRKTFSLDIRKSRIGVNVMLRKVY
jgi:hypothetical protein